MLGKMVSVTFWFSSIPIRDVSLFSGGGGGGGPLFWGERVIIFSLLSGEGHNFFQGFLGEGHKFF